MPKLIIGLGVLLMMALAALALWLDRPAATVGLSLAAPSTGIVDATPGAIYSTQFPDSHGKQRSLGEWQHKLLVINFWATWCAPCREEMPMLAKLQREFATQGLQIIGIAADSQSNVVNFSEKTPVGYPLLPDETRAIDFSRRLGNRLGLLPFTVILKPGGAVIFTRLGVVTEGEMREIVMKNISK